jgi:seryl-tRNA synthetase
VKLSRRIRDLIRANLTPRRLAGSRQARSPDRLEAQLEQIRKSLVQAAGREKRLQDELLLAEQEGRERDTMRLRRELADLSQSTEELRAALDLIEARIEVAQEAKSQDLSAPSPPETEDSGAPESSLTSVQEETDLERLKARLAAPEKKYDAKDKP